MILSVYDKGIINGYQTESGAYFKPNENMTRAEFAVIMCKFLDIDTAESAVLRSSLPMTGK